MKKRVISLFMAGIMVAGMLTGCGGGASSGGGNSAGAEKPLLAEEPIDVLNQEETMKMSVVCLPVSQRAEGGHEPGGSQAGDPLLRGKVQRGRAAVHGEAPGPARDHGLGAGERPAGRHIDQGAGGA